MAYAPTTSTVRPSDKVAALDKMAKAVGMYREPERDHHPIRISQVTVVLNHGAGRTTTETQQIDPPPHNVIDGESRILPEDEAGC